MPTKDYYRVIKLRMRGDTKFNRLSKPQPNAQSLFEWLLTPPAGGIIPCFIQGGLDELAHARGWPVRDFERCFDEIAAEKMVMADWSAKLIWLPNGLKHNTPESPKCFLTWGRAWSIYPECELRDFAFVQLLQFVEFKVRSARSDTKLAQKRLSWRNELGANFAEEIRRIQERIPAIAARMKSLIGSSNFDADEVESSETDTEEHDRPPMRLPIPSERPKAAPRPALQQSTPTMPRPSAPPPPPPVKKPMTLFTPPTLDFDDGRKPAAELVEDGITYGDYRRAAGEMKAWFLQIKLPYDGKAVLELMRGLMTEPVIDFGDQEYAPHRLVHFAVHGLMLERLSVQNMQDAFSMVRDRILKTFAGKEMPRRAVAQG